MNDFLKSFFINFIILNELQEGNKFVMEKFCNRFLLVFTEFERSFCNIEVILFWFRRLESFRKLLNLFDIFVKHFIICFPELFKIGFELLS